MRALLAVGAATLTLVGLGACCPIPIDREVSVRPQLDIRVADASGTGVLGAKITARRLIVGPPPLTERDRWTGNTGPKGRVVLAELKDTEPHMPLMMHGVNWYGWQVCAEHEGKAAIGEYNATQPVVADPVRIDLQLTEVTTCEALLALD